MRIDFKTVDEEKKIVQVTTSDERYYKIDEEFFPSVTYILDSSYPKGIGFSRFLKQQGDNADAIGEEARDRGSRVHHGVEILLAGKEMTHDTELADSNGVMKEITADEYGAIISFAKWWKESKAELLSCEFIVANHEHKFAGTVDLLCKIDGETWLIDLKTSKEVWPAYELQVSAYAHSLPDGVRVDKYAILQVGYKRNKNGYKFTEVQDKFDVFLATLEIFKNEHGEDKVLQREFPLSIKL